jgi:hypothetical protein
MRADGEPAGLALGAGLNGIAPPAGGEDPEAKALQARRRIRSRFNNLKNLSATALSWQFPRWLIECSRL